MPARASKVLDGAALLERLLAIPERGRDAWIDDLLGIDSPPPDAPDLPRGAVPYLPCGVEEILAVVRDAPIGAVDEVVDLGAGLGRVAILIHLLTGARTRGVELQEHLVRLARARVAALALDDVSFVHADAAKTELDGSVFFLYAPFNGPLLAAVLGRLEEVARRRSIIVCAVDLELHVSWLRPRGSSCRAVTIYDCNQLFSATSASATLPDTQPRGVFSWRPT